MSSRLEEIKARAEIVSAKHPGTEPTDREFDALVVGATADVPVLVAAVEAVLALHEPVESGRIKQCDHCASNCHSFSGLSCDDPVDAVYPCPTVQAIHTALGEAE